MPENINEKEELCSCTIIHEETVVAAKKSILDESTFYELSEFFKVFADATRIKIISILFISEMCVCDIAAILGSSQSSISHQLRVLKQARLVKFRKDGKIAYYSLNDNHIKQIYDQGLNHINEK